MAFRNIQSKMVLLQKRKYGNREIPIAIQSLFRYDRENQELENCHKQLINVM